MPNFDRYNKLPCKTVLKLMPYKICRNSCRIHLETFSQENQANAIPSVQQQQKRVGKQWIRVPTVSSQGITEPQFSQLPSEHNTLCVGELGEIGDTV